MQLNVNLEKPIDYFQYTEVDSRKDEQGNVILIDKLLPIYTGRIQKKHTDIDVLIICSDLQGFVREEGAYILMGERLPEYLKDLIEVEILGVEGARIGVLLCGDLFARIEYRGASGDARPTWNAFSQVADWVVGVAGNHDQFAGMAPQEALADLGNAHFLHKEQCLQAGFRFGGISGIIGRPTKNQRVAEAEYLRSLEQLLRQPLDFLLLHESPNVPQEGYKGNPKIHTLLEKAKQTPIVCSGHTHWDAPHAVFPNGLEVLNVDGSVFVLQIE